MLKPRGELRPPRLRWLPHSFTGADELGTYSSTSRSSFFSSTRTCRFVSTLAFEHPMALQLDTWPISRSLLSRKQPLTSAFSRAFGPPTDFVSVQVPSLGHQALVSQSRPPLSVGYDQTGHDPALSMGCDQTDRDTKPPDEYELSLGKITETLQSDYPDFFARSPDFDIYDEGVELQLGKPLEKPKVLARGRGAYCRALMTTRRVCSSMMRNGKIHCQIYDGRPYGCALRVYWKCTGQIWLGSLHDFELSAVSFYSLGEQVKRPDRNQEQALPFLAYRIKSHTIDFMEIRPISLRNKLLGFVGMPLEVQAEPEPAFAALPLMQSVVA